MSFFLPNFTCFYVKNKSSLFHSFLYKIVSSHKQTYCTEDLLKKGQGMGTSALLEKNVRRSSLPLGPDLFPVRRNQDLNQQPPRLSASAYKRETEISVSLEVQFRTCRSEHRQRSAISSWLFPLVQIRLRTAIALSSRIFCTRSCIG